MSVVAALFAMAAERASATVPNRDLVMQFAACVRRRAPDRAQALLRSEPGSDDERRKVDVIGGAYHACIKERQFLSFQIGTLRGQLAELEFRDDAAMRARAAALPAAPAVRPNVAAIDQAVAKFPPRERDGAYAVRFRAAYARCVADAKPSSVAALLGTQPASAEERAALMQSGEALMQCMPEGVTYHLIPAELRPLLLGDLYYRAASGAQAGN